MIERLDAMFAGGGCPDAIVVFVDAWTSYGGSQFINSTEHRPLHRLPRATRSCPSRRPLPDTCRRDHRGIAGKSSGGYGAMVVPMLRPEVFGALAWHAGDALFEAGYLREFPLRGAGAATASTAPRTCSSPARAPLTPSSCERVRGC